MSSIAPFVGYLPKAEIASAFTCPPYDVLSNEEARKIASAHKDNFVRVILSEVDLPRGTDPCSEPVYARAKDNLHSFIARGLLVPTPRESFFIYRLVDGLHEQTGLVAAVSLDEYLKGRIKPHEQTRPEKEEDRARHIATTRSNTGQVFLMYRSDPSDGGADNAILERASGKPSIEFHSGDGVKHNLWVVDDPADIARLVHVFQKVPRLFICDGHHRIAAAARVYKTLRRAGKADALRSDSGRGVQGRIPADSPHSRVMATIFPHNQLAILPYNRLINSLGGRVVGDILSQLEQAFDVSRTHDPRPARPGVFSMLLGSNWYRLEPKSPPRRVPPKKRIDAAVLQDLILRPILGVENPRTDPRLEFIGGHDAIRKLERRCAECGCVAAFACYPTSIEDLLFITESGGRMPPKSTWFEPKLLSGLVVRMFDR